jgi:hypothetical protein
VTLHPDFRSLLILIFIFIGCSSTREETFQSKQITRSPRYPAHWWAPVSNEGAPEWEILPQEAAPGEVILSK